MSDIQRAIEKQAKLEQSASPTPWRALKDYVDTPLERIDCFSITGHSGFNAEFIAHLRNQAKLARDVIEAANTYFSEDPEFFKGLNPRWFKQQERARDALKAWAEHVNGEKP